MKRNSKNKKIENKERKKFLNKFLERYSISDRLAG